MAEQSLKDKTIKGTFWSAADAFLGQGVTFIVGLVLARLLSPEEYGLIGICLIFTTVLSGIVDSGFSSALIRKKDASDEDYNTMFITNMFVSLLLYLVLWGSSQFISRFFSRPELVPIIRVMGLILLFQALTITQYTILIKRIDFKTKTKASSISAAISGLIGIGMALGGLGVWALVGQQLSNRLLYSILLWSFNKWRPNLSFSHTSFRYMWGFGWRMLVSSLLNNIWKEIYQLVVGKFYSPATLGHYSRAKDYANLFSQNFTAIIQRVTYPMLAEVQDEKVRMVSAYRRVIKMTMFVTASCMIFLGAISEPLIYCLIGPQWHEAATYLPFICLSMSLYPLHAINLNMLQVQGRSDIFLYLEIVKKILAIGPIVLGVFVNIYWMLVGTIIFGIISFFLNSYYTGKQLNYSSLKQIKDIAPSYGVSFAVALPVFFIKYLPVSNWIILLLQFFAGVSMTISLCKLFEIEEYKEIKQLAKPYIRTIIH